MATSREVYNRIRWDARFDRRRFVIGYLERVKNELVEVPFDAWDGTIPWHRVHYFAVEGVRVWDRATRLDRVSSGELLEGEDDTRATAPSSEAGFEPAPAWR